MTRNTLYTLCLSAGLMGASMLTACKSAAPAVQVPERSIVILFDNDVHCGIEGYDRLAGYRDAVSDTAWVGIVSSGDYLQGGTAGAISKGQYVVDIMKKVGYDAVTLGNHEFDYKIPRMKELLGFLNVPVASANLIDLTTGQQVFSPYVMKTYGTRKIAFIGVTTPTTVTTEAYAFFDEKDNQLFDLQAEKVYTLVQNAVHDARKAGADYVVVLSHLGEDKNTLNVDSHGLIASTTGIDVVLDGHTHSVIPHQTVLNREGKPVLIAQTGTKLVNVGKLVITPAGQLSTTLIPTANISLQNIEVKHAIDSIKALSDALVSRPICTSDVDLRILDENGRQAVRLGETNAGDLVTDAYRTITGADLAITNGGGIRTQLQAGKLTYGDVVSLLPYDNYVCIVEITGAELRDLLSACTRYLPVENGDFPQVSGIRFTINTQKVDTPDHISDLQILNKESGTYTPVDPAATYSLATIDYGITGGGLQKKLRNNRIIKPNIILYNDALVQYVTEHLKGHIGNDYKEIQNRIKIQ